MVQNKLPAQLEKILSESFYIRTTLIRKNGTPRTVETTYVWLQEGDVNKIILSGYPGKRDWVASMSRNSKVTVHTVEFEPWFDINSEAKVIRKLDKKLPYLIAFIEHWAQRPGFPRTRFKILLTAVKINRWLKLPWWGPFIIAKKIFNGMPCVEITFASKPILRKDEGPPPLSEPQNGRPF
tara:strand:+ start:130 stop:672 length:543 start_codon:yes stop_codon:yes gene_type:complete